MVQQWGMGRAAETGLTYTYTYTYTFLGTALKQKEACITCRPLLNKDW
ncbi:hypothetical protein C8E01_103282 [Pontibacter virosus]|uniref:Uncharacterized protein n=1 Tax=Pontibacter virosus TaxID=1765052 RepID=A0A2U1B161_9BACT|nr:hypothetical protein C8E01_103282 [Pontibacter virosus]